MVTVAKPPIWFWVVAVVFLLWEAMGCYACYMQFKLGAAAMGPVDEWSLRYYSALPNWYNWVYAGGTFAGLLGGLALLMRERRAVIAFWISLLGVLVIFGYAFAATDLIAHKGLSQVLPFPLFIVAMGVFSIWFAVLSARRGWMKA